jgi:acetoacetyl-CoA synthetase
VEGEAGELVVTVPFPSMPVSFWKDPAGSLYRGAYFDKFPGVWAHGDFLLINPKTRGFFMLGRSDGTLNPSGVRFGSAEIYNIVEQFKEVCTERLNMELDLRSLFRLKLEGAIGQPR